MDTYDGYFELLESPSSLGKDGYKVAPSTLNTLRNAIAHNPTAHSLLWGFVDADKIEAAQRALATWEKKEQIDTIVETLLLAQSTTEEAFFSTSRALEKLGMFNKQFPKDSWHDGKKDNNPYLSAMYEVAKTAHHGGSLSRFAPTMVTIAGIKGFEKVAAAIEHYLPSGDPNEYRRKTTRSAQKSVKSLNDFLENESMHALPKKLWNGSNEYRATSMRVLALSSMWGNSQNAIQRYGDMLQVYKGDELKELMPSFVGVIPAIDGQEALVQQYVDLMVSLKDDTSRARIITRGQSDLGCRNPEDTEEVSKPYALGRSMQLARSSSLVPVILDTFDRLKDESTFFDFAERIIFESIVYNGPSKETIQKYG